MSCRASRSLALVIGSGGVRAASALGVAEVLHGEGLAPSCIVGCSAGALFGALLATGRPVHEAVHTATALWTQELTRRRRWRAPAQMMMPRLLGFDASFALRDDAPVLERLHAAFGTLRFEDLPVPLRVTATCAESGGTIVLDQGRLVDALRASIALPFMFAPQQLAGRRLVDGVVSDPLPVSAAIDAGAILAVGAPAPLPRRIDGPSRMLSQLVSTMSNNLLNARLCAARASGPPLMVLSPEPSRRVGLFDTAALPELVETGRREARARLPEILALVGRC
ncbi:patatin-like phospholipase family protein [Roseateles cellulosilyticus]|uniref:Patatin-like phospholipase family protein n=1 Tax=Pelomonas cellulosilytica TaxID=2906762 RepID=A0ABS8Y0F9_9BURK|nr:patatin-like phospholipase family protein [Pelomonas sp. P8]MCE4557073.1 patatin-like phospholipase family protein [Pelomonas sp. P8]